MTSMNIDDQRVMTNDRQLTSGPILTFWNVSIHFMYVYWPYFALGRYDCWRIWQFRQYL